MTTIREFDALDILTHLDDECGYYPGRDNPCMRSYSSEATTPAVGVWYNYAAATAGTIVGEENSTDATESICPKGWTLPTSTQMDNLENLIGDDATTFDLVFGGWYYGGGLLGDDDGYWWSSTNDGEDYRYAIYGYEYNGNYRLYLEADYESRTDGFFVRCVLR